MKPEILEDEKAASLSDSAWRLWVSMWLLADDHGRLRGSVTWLRGVIFWSGSHNDKAVEAMLVELAEKHLVIRYEVEGQRYVAIPNWKKHQRVDHPGPPRIPEPPTNMDANESRTIRETFAPDLGTGTGTDPDLGLGRGLDSSAPVLPAPPGVDGLGAILQHEWCVRTGVTMANGIGQLVQLLREYAAAKGRLVSAQLAVDCVDACVRHAAAMSPGRRVSMAPMKFCEDKHWAAVQEIMNGTRRPESGAEQVDKKRGTVPMAKVDYKKKGNGE